MSLVSKDMDLDFGDDSLKDLPPSDKGARDEEKNLFGDKRRRERTKQVFHRMFIAFVYVAAMMAILVFITRVLHLILPSYCHWLDEVQIQNIDKILFSGLIGGFVSKYVKYIMPGMPDD